MTEHAHIRVFVAHAAADDAFVHGYLVPALGLPEDEVLVSSQLAPGAVIVDEIARGARSPATIAVLSPAFTASPWSAFAERLALHHAVESGAGGSVVIPVVLADCELSLVSRFRVPLDFRNRATAQWDAEAARLRDCVGAPEPRAQEIACPYPGTRPFTAEEAGQFHARDAEIHALLECLRRGEREILIVGPRSAGKSSLVAAGVVPRLADPKFVGDRFAVCAMRPGTDPAGELSKALAVQHDQAKVLLIVDQLEEAFTAASRWAREAFAVQLDQLRRDPRVTLMLVVSAEVYDRLLDSRLWSGPATTPARIEVATLRGEALREAIVRPASQVGVYCEPALVERLLRDESSDSRPLPRLQETLVELWQQRRYNLLLQHDPANAGPRAAPGHVVPGLGRLAHRARWRPRPAHNLPEDDPCGLHPSDETDDRDGRRGALAWLRAGQDWWTLVMPLVVLAVCSAVLRAC
jgi:hypothetical protein